MSTIKVLSAGAVRRALAELSEAYRGPGGEAVEVAFHTAPQIRELLAEGTGDLDVIVGPVSLLDHLEERGLIDAVTRVELGGVKAAIALPTDAPAIDIASSDAVREAVRRASEVIFNTASSGQYVEKMLVTLGVADEVAGKVKRFPDAEAAMAYLGKSAPPGAIGFGQSSAIRVYEPLGVRQLGVLPAGIGNVTTYHAAVATGAPNRDAAKAFLTYLVSDGSLARFRETGVE